MNNEISQQPAMAMMELKGVEAALLDSPEQNASSITSVQFAKTGL
jgi:hypothetical protein